MQIENTINLFNEDCLNRFKQLDDNSIDLIVTDPPYGIHFGGQTSNTDWDSFTDEDFILFMNTWMTESFRVLKENGTMWMFCDRTKIPDIFKIVDSIGFNNNLENWCIWARSKGRGSSKKLKSIREDILHLTKSKKYTWNSIEYLKKVICPYTDKDGNPRGWATDIDTGDRVRFSGLGNVLFYSSPSWSSIVDKQIHSTQKPVALNLALIMMSSNKDDIVFDPFSGSGSTAIAAMTCERNFIGCEKDYEMYTKALHRIETYNPEEYTNYYKKHISSSEKNFKFGFSSRNILPK